MLRIDTITLPHGEGLEHPVYASSGASGADLRAALKQGAVTLAPMRRVLIPTGLSLLLPAQTEAQIRPRSGLALRYGITCLNSPGTIDSDYRGEVKILLINLGDAPFRIEHGYRIAQLVIAHTIRADFVVAKTKGTTKRGGDGFGSTGLA